LNHNAAPWGGNDEYLISLNLTAQLLE